MNIEKEFKKIANDTVNGASFITYKTIKVSKKALILNIPYEQIKTDLLFVKNRQNMMASVYNFIESMIHLLNKNENKEKIISFCDSFIENLTQSSKKAVKNAIKEIPNKATILTHSFSSLVFNTIIESIHKGKQIKIFCTESRPKNEGISLYKNLTKHKIDATLITDAEAGFLMNECDIFLIGADAVGEKFLIHKIGTFPIALTAKYFNKKVISISTKQKFWKNSKPKEHPKNPQEIIKEDIKALNLYFDFTPINIIDKIITD